MRNYIWIYISSFMTFFPWNSEYMKILNFAFFFSQPEPVSQVSLYSMTLLKKDNYIDVLIFKRFSIGLLKLAYWKSLTG